ncbi:signal peptide peptidase SppA [Ferruginivarius sediminum]|uniref:Signal peptide peptidase SppA n=1 Tax=Ferruginivarius sediminum TaxID=2661937 RepID=A0A369TB51_9PROT|nr:signal peptide peptidase SppA [Ferruginivarius sediminum]RDD62539.1 signal peptide peptidase SppA [Ferruginivarius sediminum]
MRLILFLLKCIVGFLASVGLIVLLLGVAAGVFWQRVEEFREPAPEIPETTVLSLDLSSGVVERQSDNPLARARAGGAVVLHDAVDALDAAAADRRVKGLAVRLGRGSIGFAQAQELHQAVSRFRESGKPAYAFAETLNGMGAGATLHGYLTSAFDEVWMQPSGDWSVAGFKLESPFLRGLLDELGIQPRLEQREEYKGLKNQFTDRELPEPQRRNLQRLLDSWLAQVVDGLSEGRDLEAAKVRQLIDSAPLSAEDARDAGLIDRLDYRDAFEAALREAAGPDAENLDLRDYAAQRLGNLDEDAPRVAVIHGEGAVSLAESENNPIFGDVVMGSDTIAPAIREALEDDTVEAIIFRIDSPGGSYVASDTIWKAVRDAREAEKPIVVSMGNIAASGGYFVAAPANRIVAQPGTLTGSIGVVSGKFVFEGLWDKLEVNFDGVQAGKQADFWSPNSDFSDAQWQRLQELLDETYADFTGKVAEGRGLSPTQVREAAQGKVWSGADAREMGLVDELGGFRHAVAVAKSLAGIDEATRVRLQPFPAPEDPLRKFLSQALKGRVDSPAARTLGRIVQTLQPLVDALTLLEGTSGEQRLRASHLVEETARPH